MNDAEAVDLPSEPGIRFGRTLIVTRQGDPLAQGAEGVVVAANQRGVMGAVATPGLVGLRSLGGSEIEREAMARAPLELGTALVTGAAGLDGRGTRAIIHAVVHQSLGDRARIEHVRRATSAALVAADRHRLRTIAMPLLGLGAGTTDTDLIVTAVVTELVAALRRATLRIEQVTLACRFAEQTEAAAAAVRRAREQSWPTRV